MLYGNFILRVGSWSLPFLEIVVIVLHDFAGLVPQKSLDLMNINVILTENVIDMPKRQILSLQFPVNLGDPHMISHLDERIQYLFLLLGVRNGVLSTQSVVLNGPFRLFLASFLLWLILALLLPILVQNF